MRSRFDQQLAQLHRELITMGSLCETAISRSAKALEQGDMALAGSVQEIAQQIDEKERHIEGMCMKLLLQQQPVARDLRVVSSALKMVTDMERIGNQSADIAEIITMGVVHTSDNTENIRHMAQAAIRMVTGAIDAFVEQNVALARQIIAADDEVDGYFTAIKQALVDQFRQPDTKVEAALDLLMIAKYFERIADHAVNIAGWVLFSITGNREGE